VAEFADQAEVRVQAGNGGNGCASVRREKFIPLGGPDGGNGGRGGDVILEVDSSVTTLLDFHFHPHQKADSGRMGQGSNRHGASGSDVVLRVPNGTVVVAPDRACRLVIDDRLLRFSFEGWTDATPRPIAGDATVLTPPTSVAALAHGYQPLLHPSTRG